MMKGLVGALSRSFRSIGASSAAILFSAFLAWLLSFCLLPSARATGAPGDEYVFGADTPVTLTHTASEQSPDVSGSIAVWTDLRPTTEWKHPSRIFIRDLSKDEQERPLVDAPDKYQSNQAIDGNLVVWLQEGNIHYMFLGDGCPGAAGCDRTLQLPGAAPGNLALSGHRIVWQDTRAGSLQAHIYMYDLDNPGEQVVCATDTRQILPAIDGDWVVWLDYSPGTPLTPCVDIHARNVVTREDRRITTDCGAVFEEFPRISGATIVWDAGGGLSYPSTAILTYNLVSGETRRIATGGFLNARPDIFRDKIVWQRTEAPRQAPQIWMYDISTGISQQVSHGSADLGAPAVTDSRIVWQDNREGQPAIYQNRIGDNARALAEKYAPHLYLHPEEYFEPRSVDIMLAGAGTRLMQDSVIPGGDSTLAAAPSLSAADLGSYFLERDEPGKTGTGKYVDLPGNDALAWGFPTEWLLRHDYVDRYRELAASGRYPETVYARLVPDCGSGNRTVLQYWLSYYFNNFNDYHEGDWELAEVVFGPDLEPQAVGLSQHTGGSRRRWDNVEGPDSHPVIYVARGSHAGYFAAGDYNVPVPVLPDATDHAAAGLLHAPAVEMLPDVVSGDAAGLRNGPYAWLAYRGAWGELTGLPGGDGPQGPAAAPEHSAIWDDPLAWFDGLRWDGEPETAGRVSGELMASTGSDEELDLFDSDGRHVGKNASGGIDRQVPGAEYLEVPGSGHSIIVHGQGAGLRFVLSGGASGGSHDFQASVPQVAADQVKMVRFNGVPAGGQAVFDPAAAALSLQADLDGDGSFEQTLVPDSVSSTKIDLMPPAASTDLTLASVSSHGATLTFTAPGDSSGAAASVYYDVRYSIVPPSEENWRDAQPLAAVPGPQQPGTKVTADIDGLAAGTTYYVALRSRDAALWESGLSNMVTFTTTRPRLSWSGGSARWADLADYLDRRLAVEYELANTGDASARRVALEASSCSPDSVNLSTPLPLAIADIPPGGSHKIELQYRVPDGIARFTARTFADCVDGAGRVYHFPEAR